VESLYASVLWTASRLGLGSGLQWVQGGMSFNLVGPEATAVLPYARALFALLVLASVALACVAAWRVERRSAAAAARLFLVPLLAFICFNYVFSPQYLIWVLPLAAVATLEGRFAALACVLAATVLSPAIYPSFDDAYVRGLNGYESGLLLLRNLLLVAAWAMLAVQAVRLARTTAAAQLPSAGETDGQSLRR